MLWRSSLLRLSDSCHQFPAAAPSLLLYVSSQFHLWRQSAVWQPFALYCTSAISSKRKQTLTPLQLRKQLPCCSHSRVTVRDRILTPMFVCFRFRIESSAQLPRQTPARARHAPRTQRELQPCPKTSHTILSALPLQHVLVAVVCVIVLLLSLSHQQP